MAKFNEQNAEQHGCTDTLNCTASQLADKQWGSSAITLNPLLYNDDFLGVSYTMADWGTYPSVMTIAPEFKFYYQQYR